MSTYSQLILTQVIFSSGESRRGWEEKPNSKLRLDFSKRGFTTSSYTSSLGFNTKTLRLINWQAQMQFHTKQSKKVIF